MRNAEKPMFSEMVVKARKQSGWTQVKLAKELKIDTNTVSRWERGEHIPKEAGIIENLCELFEMTPEALGLLEEKLSFYLSYAPADVEYANQLKADLQNRGIFLENEKELLNRAEPDEILRRALRKARAVIFLASPHASCSPTIKEELGLAQMYGRPVYTLWIAGQQRKDVLPAQQAIVRAIDTFDARGACYTTAVDALVTALKEFSQQSFEPRNPYKSLLPFNCQDAPDFFGREQLIEKLVDKLQQILAQEGQGSETARLLAVMGPSGSGKSSVVMAGLLPRLQRDELPQSKQWVYLKPIVPGAHPLEALALALSEYITERSLTSIHEDLQDNTARGFHLLAASLAKQPETKVVLVVDQFEELFTQTTDEQERQQFIDLLVTASRVQNGPVLVILTLRADFYDRPMNYLHLGKIIEEQSKSVLPMNARELQAVIEQPAGLPGVQLTLEENLVRDLLAEMQGQMGALPLLQFTLDQLFQHRNGHMLTWQAYEEIGGVKGALTKQAESTYVSLPSKEHSQLARVLFLRLVDPGITEQDMTRRRASLAEFSLDDVTTTRLLHETIDAFIGARLLTANEVAGTKTLEISHEAVMREWKRLAQWVGEAREDLHVLQVIRADAAEWNRQRYSIDRLYRGTQLAEALAWRERSLLSLDEVAFLQASLAEREHQAVAIREQQQQEEARQKRYTRRTVLAIGGTGLVGLGLAATSAFLVMKYFPSSVRIQVANSSSISQQLVRYIGHTDAVNSVAWSPDGTLLASGSNDRTVQVWNATTLRTLLTYRDHTSYVYTVAWSPDGKHIASGGNDNTVRVWEAATGKLKLTYQLHTAGVNTVAWSHNGNFIASGGGDNTVHVWNAITGKPKVIYTGHGALVHALAWSPNDNFIASASNDGTVQVWYALTGKLSVPYAEVADAVTSVSWSPDGKRITSADNTNSVQTWNAATGYRLLTYRGHTDAVTSTAWSPSGQHIASASNDHTVQVWGAGITHITYTGHTAPTGSVAWSPDSKYIASSSKDGVIQVWNANNGTPPLLSYPSEPSMYSPVAWSPNGRFIASGGNGHTVQLWHAMTGITLHTFQRHTAGVSSVAWSPDNKFIASASSDGTVQIWDATIGSHILAYTGHSDSVHGVVWSPDGTRIASASQDGTVQIWDATTGSHILTYTGHISYVYGLAWAPDGTRIASVGVDKTVQLWNADNGRNAFVYRDHSNYTLAVAWSPDSKRIASGGFDNTVRVWDATPGNTQGHTLYIYSGHTSYVYSIAWAENGACIASTGTYDKTVQVWQAV